MYASLPPLSRAPLSSTGSLDCYQGPAGLSRESRNFSIEDRNVGHFGQKRAGRPRSRYDLALTEIRPRPIVAAAIACHADRREVPSGRFSTVLRAYTAIR